MISRREAIRTIGLALVGSAIASNPEIQKLAGLAPRETQALAAQPNPLGGAEAGSISFKPAKEISVSAERDKKYPTVIDFSLRAVGKNGNEVAGSFYKVQGDGNNEEFYLYQAIGNQSQSNIDPSQYSRNTKVVARFTSEIDAQGNQQWKREDLNQATAIIRGNALGDKCDDICPEAKIIVEETDSEARAIPGGEKDAFIVRDISPYVLCDRWGNWYDNPPLATPTPEFTPTPTPTLTPTPPPTRTPGPTPKKLPGTGN